MPPTLARRYFFKLASNLVSVPVYLIMEAVLPRALGPRAYGDYNFATSVFQQLSGFLDMGTSTCFYNELSRRPEDGSLVSFYLRVALIVFALMTIAGLALLWPTIGSLALPDTPLWYAPLAAIWAFLTWASRVLRSMNDAAGLTVSSEIWRSAISIAAALLLLALFFANALNIASLFVQQYIFLGASALAFWLIVRAYWKRRGATLSLSLPSRAAKIYARQFFNYSHPLFVQALLSFVLLTSERWLLQWFDGGTQQGFYALSQKISMACFLFVSAMTPLLMREFSIAWGKKDLNAMGSLLSRFAPMLYALAAYFSCFTVAEAKTLVSIFGGAEFAAAVLPVQIMALYPLHQAYGQMAGSVFHASGKTKILRNIAALECVYGLALAWIFIAPSRLCGLNLGASGLAIKTVLAQFITVNLYLWMASRLVPFDFWRNLARQFLIVFVLLGAAYVCGFAASLILPESVFPWRFILSGVLYTTLYAAIAFTFPALLGLSKRERRELIARFWKRKTPGRDQTS